ncbi:MAG: T9SS type A sorting domain-containing protein, partial [Bacteroidota bacterium]
DAILFGEYTYHNIDYYRYYATWEYNDYLYLIAVNANDQLTYAYNIELPDVVVGSGENMFSYRPDSLQVVNGQLVGQLEPYQVAIYKFETDSLDPPPSIEPLYPLGDNFPLGLYALYDNFEEAGEFGWNCSHTYQAAPVPDAYFDTSLIHGLNTMARLSYIDSIGEKWRQPESTTISEIIQQSQNQNLAWWDIPEELRYWYDNELEIVQTYTQLTRLHDCQMRPNFMYIPGHYGSEGIENYIDYLDIIPASCYPNWQELPHAYVRWSIEETFEAIQNQGFTIGADYLNGEKTVMSILELFEGDTLLSAEGTWHDFWLSLACDVKGILLFSHFYRNASPTLTASWNKINQAINLFKSEHLDEAMIQGTTTDLETLLNAGPSLSASFAINNETVEYPSLKTIGKTWNDTLFVIAVNSASEEIGYQIENISQNYNTYRNLVTHEIKMISNGTIMDTLSNLGVSVFKLYNQENTTTHIDLQNDLIALYPSPTKDKFIINGITDVFDIKIFDPNGKTYLNTTKDRMPIEIDLSTLPSGLYFVQIMKGSKIFIKRVVKE